MQSNLYDIRTTDDILAQCLLIFARRGAQIRAELRAQYGIEEGDRRMSELAREAERALWPDRSSTPGATLSRETASVASIPISKPPSIEKHSTPS